MPNLLPYFSSEGELLLNPEDIFFEKELISPIQMMLQRENLSGFPVQSDVVRLLYCQILAPSTNGFFSTEWFYNRSEDHWALKQK